jgi:hypothetical protein
MTNPKPIPRDWSSLEALRNRIILTLDFMANIEFIDESLQMIRSITEENYRNKNLRNMRSIAREVDELTVALPSHHRDGLEALLRDRLGVDKEAERAQLRARAEVALRRGGVASEKERQHLERYVEMLQSMNEGAEEIRSIQGLLSL